VPGWTWDSRGDNWDEGYAHLLRYAETFHSAAVPQTYVDDMGYRLGVWVATQRRRHKNGYPRRQPCTSAPRAARLDMERCCLPGATSKATVTLASLLRGTNRDGCNTRHVVTNQRARRNRLDARAIRRPSSCRSRCLVFS
jgi:Helicase associated domain